MTYIQEFLKIIIELFKIKNIKAFHKIMIIFVIFTISISVLLFIDNTFYFSKHIYNKNKLENIEKICLLLEKENISLDDKKYLNELKENIINKNNLINNIEILFTTIIENINKNIAYKYKEYSDKNINIILYIITYSWLFIIFWIIAAILIFNLFRKKEL